MRILIFSLMLLFALYGTSFANMKPVSSFEDRTPTPYKNNPFGLVYGDAITENVSSKVNIHLITYQGNSIYFSDKHCDT